MRKILTGAIVIFLFASLSYAENIQIGCFNIQYLGDGSLCRIGFLTIGWFFVRSKQIDDE